LRLKTNLPEAISGLLRKDKIKIILHPKSNASAREWSLENFTELVNLLPEDRYQIILTGGEKEAEAINSWKNILPPHVVNLAGRLSLGELISLLDSTDGIVAASTGPLHISAALGKHALGIYPPIRPMDPQRWAPLGEKAEFLVINKTCSDCRTDPSRCHCMNEITPQQVADRFKCKD
jgi:ADP-heptose:LPS heptosyltransferase